LVATTTQGAEVLDIGTCAGKSAIAMALAAPNVRVTTIDPQPNPCLSDQLEQCGVSNRVTFLQVTSEEYAKECPPLDLCFIDGLHTYAGVRHDIEQIATKVRPGGYILIHDTNLYADAIGRAAKEFEGKVYEFIEEAEGEEFGADKAASVYVGRRL
jgi:predicted O-methyltransferase YrrM